MKFRSVGINLTGNHLSGERELAGGRPDQRRMEAIETVLEDANIGLAVHVPHDMNLMDLSSQETHHGAL